MVKIEQEKYFVCEVCNAHKETREEAERCEDQVFDDTTLPIGTLVTNPPMDMIYRVVEHKTRGHLRFNILETIHGKTFGGLDFYEAQPHQIKKLKEWLEVTMPKPGEVECPKCGKPFSPKWADYALQLLCNQYDHDSDEGFDEEFE